MKYGVAVGALLGLGLAAYYLSLEEPDIYDAQLHTSDALRELVHEINVET